MQRGHGSAPARHTVAPQLPHSRLRESETQKARAPSQQSDWGVTVASVWSSRHVPTQTEHTGRGATAAAPAGATYEAGSQGTTSTWSTTVRVQMAQQTVTGGGGTAAAAGTGTKETM